MRPPLSQSCVRSHNPRRTYAGLAISAAAHGLVALVIAVAPRGVEREARPAATRAEHVAYVDIGGWPGAEAAVTRMGTADAGRTAATDAGRRGAARSGASPAADANRPAIQADSSAAAGPAGASAQGVAGGTAAGAPARTTGTRLGPEYGDPRLVVARPPSARAWADAARYEADFRTAWRAFRDSIQHSMDRERLAASWTWKDPNGRAWGVRTASCS